jgi:diacylglycerol kinase (ATP)
MRSGSLLWSFDYAIRGIVYAVRTQRNMRLHLLTAVLVFVGALALGVGGLELIALLFAVGLVIVAELMNTAIETTVDLATDGFDPLAAVAKDVAAGAVLISAVTAVAVGYVVFFNRVTPLAQGLMQGVRSSSATVTMIAFALTSIAVLALKAVTHEKGTSFLRGGWPSGHTALAFSVASAVGYSVSSAKAMVMSLFVAAMVAQSRAETGAHTIPQIVAGAILGFLLTTAAFQIFWR